MEQIESHDEAGSSRKRFLLMVGGTGAAGAVGLLAAACGDGGGQPDSAEQKPEEPVTGDLEIVQYALTLEYLEAKFYADVLEAGVLRDSGLVKTAEDIAQNELEHVEVLRALVSQLGANPAPDPEGDFQSVIEQGERAVLETAAIVENVGAAAYLGQAPLIQDPDILAAALSIHTVEARHAAALNKAYGFAFATNDPLEGSVPNGPFAKPLDMAAVLKQIEPFLPKDPAGSNGKGNS